MADILMPQLGETVTEGTVTRWLKHVGDQVAEDEVLFEVSTDKVDSEVPSPAAGVVSEILVAEGDTVDVGTRLAIISDGAGAGNGRAAPVEADAAAPSTDQVAAEEAGPTLEAEEAPAPVATEPAPDQPEAPEPLTAPTAGSGERRNGAATRPSDDRPPSGPNEGGNGKVLSPVVRRLIAQYDLDPAGIPGSGAGGRITRGDVLAVIDQRQAGSPASQPQPSARGTAAPTAAPASSVPSVPSVPFAPSAPGEHDTVIPFTNIRRRTAEHMVRSKATSAHAMVAVEVDYSAVDKVRSVERSRFKEAEGFSLTYLPFIARAAVDAIGDFPIVNSSVGDDSLVVHNDLNLGIAVDLDFEGLLVPVIHQADGVRLRQLARDISTLAGKARARKLTMDDISGGTFTITNAGGFGTLITVPVINQPQVAILSTDGVKKKPVVVELADGTDSIAIHPVGNLVMSWDHRAFDGAYAAAFIAGIKHIIETRDWAAEL